MGNDSHLSITAMRKHKFAYQIGKDILPEGNGAVADSYFEAYSGNRSYEDIFETAFNAKYVVDLIKAVWGAEPPYKLLDCGSANGLTLKQFDKLGVEAWGIENSAYMHSKTPKQWRERNLLGDVRKMPFKDGSFDFIYETCLPYLPEENIDQAIKELAPNLTATAHAPDGIIEGVEGTGGQYLVAVQWHPEELTETQPGMARLFSTFVDASSAA